MSVIKMPKTSAVIPGEPKGMSSFRERVLAVATELAPDADICFWSKRGERRRDGIDGEVVEVLFATIHLERHVYCRVGHVDGDAYGGTEEIPWRKPFETYARDELTRAISQAQSPGTELLRRLSHASPDEQQIVALLIDMLTDRVTESGSIQDISLGDLMLSSEAVHLRTGLRIRLGLSPAVSK